MFQPCHGHFPSSAFLVDRRGICVHPVLCVVAPAWARLLGNQVSARCDSSPLHPTIFFLFFLFFSSFQQLMTADVAPSMVSISPPSLLPLPLISPLPYLSCFVSYSCALPFSMSPSFCGEGRIVCLPNRVSLCSNRSCPGVLSLSVSDGFF